MGIVFSALRAPRHVRGVHASVAKRQTRQPQKLVPSTGVRVRISPEARTTQHHPASPWKGQPRDGGGTCLENRLPLTGRRSSTLLLSAYANTPPSSSGRGHRSFTAGTRVRIPLGGRLTERGWRKSVSPVSYARYRLLRVQAPPPMLTQEAAQLSYGRVAGCNSLVSNPRPRGPTDTAAAFYADECRFDSCRGHRG